MHTVTPLWWWWWWCGCQVSPALFSGWGQCHKFSQPGYQKKKWEMRLRFKGALKAHKHISLYESYTLQEQDATILFLSVSPWGEIFAYCHPPRQPLPATGCGHVFQVLSAVTQSGGRDHILSPSYLWVVYLTAVLLTRALCTSCIKTYISNKKMVKSCAAIGCKKDTVVEKAFIDFLVVNLDKNSG